MRNWTCFKPCGAAGAGALIWMALASAAAAGAQTYSVVHTFTGGDGSRPFGNLLLRKGTLYGTTSGGGAGNAGTVFALGVEKKAQAVLHSFAGGPSDGAAPLAGLIGDSLGNLYGVTFDGGANNKGTLFEVAFEGSFAILHSFAGEPVEGANPAGTLVADGAGNMYGTTYVGGSTLGWGTTFEWSAGGVFFTGQSFSPDGALPRAGLSLTSGHLFGTTCGGGGSYGYGGTVFEAGLTSALYTFTGGADGAEPMANVIGDGEGNLYGTAAGGGTSSLGSGHGVVFEVNIATGQETVLYTFQGPDGATPTGSLVRDKAGNLYGTTLSGGAANYGTVFELDTEGQLTTLYSFTGGADGAQPFAGLILDPNGNLWGVASAGGSAAAPGGDGVVFEIVIERT